MKKLQAYGISRKLLKWLDNYIIDRHQRVCIGNNFSEIGNLKGGVPQGSVLGPLLFLIFINDIADNSQSLSRLFADDTSLSYSSNNIHDIETVLNADLATIFEWSKKWLVNFNPKKTECVLFSPSKLNDKPNLYLMVQLLKLQTIINI